MSVEMLNSELDVRVLRTGEKFRLQTQTGKSLMTDS